MGERRHFPGRTFQLWEYQVGHAQLLLRSPKEGAHLTRLEIAFKNVQAVKIPTLIRDLSIGIADTEPSAAALAEAGTAVRTSLVFAIDGSGFQGYVIAGIAFGHEDEGEYFDPSPLLSGYWAGPGWEMN